MLGFPLFIGGVGTIEHVGLLSDRVGADGLPAVVHSSKLQGVVGETSMSAFVERAQGPMRIVGYPGALPPAAVLARARARIGERWSPFSNCEHFVSYAHGLEPRSPQLDRILGLRRK